MSIINFLELKETLKSKSMQKLEKLELKRDAIHRKLAKLGDFTRGTISVNY
jgi:hypothetical protein